MGILQGSMEGSTMRWYEEIRDLFIFGIGILLLVILMPFIFIIFLIYEPYHQKKINRKLYKRKD